METRCADPAECLYFLTSRPWADCTICEGSGYAGEYSVLDVFCPICGGSGLNEYGPGEITPDEISDRAKKQHAAHVARLTALVPPARLAVAA
ncbi:hypothetical protein ABT124_02205 [Streptomyces sp. NPDC001982]|uniref:hypothetical protein n=1 Tax=Streptomyces sp. NPDC001982 TaxID=3154405 RepID=UPI0033239567